MSQEDTAPVLSRGRGRTEAQEEAAATSGKHPLSPGAEANENKSKRGKSREQREIAYYKTRPETVNNKTGSSGSSVDLMANYFRLAKLPNFEVIQYRIDFEPEVELFGLRRALIAQHKAVLGGYIYDGGNLLFVVRRLPEDKFELTSKSREEVEYKLVIKNTGNVISPTDNRMSQVLNLILKRAMGGLKLQLIGRNLFDPANKVDLREFHLELWPGYVTSIRQHEGEIMLCCEISHKVMREETVYDLIQQCRKMQATGRCSSARKSLARSC